MKRVALVSCVKSKKRAAAPAADLYTSPLFRSLRQYAEAHADEWYILSAEHGLLQPHHVVAPYERTLNKMSKPDRLAWAERVKAQLADVLPPGAEVIVLAGERYREDLLPFLERSGFSVSVPLEGLSFGKQLQQLKEWNSTLLQGPIDRFYELVARLEELPNQGLPLGEYTGRSPWPDRGVYFFFEPGEYRAHERSAARVVRVGTHAVSAGSKSSLWGRLRAHLGRRDGSGSHRSSIFRLHVGAALLQRNDGSHVTSWGSDRPADAPAQRSEADHERRVSEYLSQMRVMWVRVDDEPGKASHRGFIERNVIALISNKLMPPDPPSSHWLGLHSARLEIQSSGLWNVNHVEDDYDAAFLDIFESYVSRMRTGASSSAAPGCRPSIPSVPEQQVTVEAGVAEDEIHAAVAATQATNQQPAFNDLPYARRSSFVSTIAEALDVPAGSWRRGEAVEITLPPGGYDGEYLVRIAAENQDYFDSTWGGADQTRFPTRIRAAATALRDRGDHGDFLISHRDGLLTITRTV